MNTAPEKHESVSNDAQADSEDPDELPLSKNPPRGLAMQDAPSELRNESDPIEYRAA